MKYMAQLHNEQRSNLYRLAVYIELFAWSNQRDMLTVCSRESRMGEHTMRSCVYSVNNDCLGWKSVVRL